MATHITTAGLVLDILGVVILFYYGPPAGITTLEGHEMITTEPDPERARIARRQYRISQLGLLFLFLGFVLQVWGNVAQSSSRSSHRDPTLPAEHGTTP